MPHALAYAPLTSSRRKLILRFLLLFTFLTLAAAALKYGPPAYRRLVLLYWQRQCLAYTPPPDLVVYEDRPREAAALLARPGYFPFTTSGPPQFRPSTLPATTAAAYRPSCYDAFLNSQTPRSYIPARPGAIIFLGRLKSPNGQPHLVALEYIPDWSTFQLQWIDGFNYNSAVWLPATPIKPPDRIWCPLDLDILTGSLRQCPDTTIHAGQPDPADPSHFTVQYRMYDQDDTLDVRLTNQGRLTLTPRHPIHWPGE